MTIIHIIGTLNIGGVQKYILQLSQSPSLNQYTHKVLCTILNVDNYRDEYDKNHISIQHLPFLYSPNTQLPHRIDKLCRLVYAKFYFFRMWYYLLTSEANIVHSHIHNHIVSQISAVILSGKRMIWTIHGEYSLGGITIWVVRFLKFILPSTKFQIVADSKPALFSTLPFTRKNSDSNNIIPTGIDLKPYSEKYNKSFIREKYNLTDNTIIIGSTGRIVWQKGYDQLLLLIENYDLSEKNVYFLIAGEGSLKKQYIKRIEENQLENYINFIGNIKNIPEFLSALDIYIQPSVTEGFPLSVLEAMASDLPVICSDAGGMKDMITNGVNGLVYPSGDVEQMYKAINNILLMGDKELAEFSVKARDEVINNYNIEHISGCYKRLYFES